MSQYQNRMQKRIKRKNLPKDTVLDWKNDAGEHAQHIWKWWKPRKDKYPYHGVAIHLIVLAHLLGIELFSGESAFKFGEDPLSNG